MAHAQYALPLDYAHVTKPGRDLAGRFSANMSKFC